ncbi:MAG: tautomerase family protein [Deltaproteobacteria bacterium]
MPIAQINVLAGHPRERLQLLLREVSRAYADVLGSPMNRLQVWINEIDPGLYAIGGEPADALIAAGDRAALEIPLARLVLLGDRPQSHVTEVITRLTEVISTVLESSAERVRVEVVRVPPENWGIGGVPASEKRKAEIEARKKS